MRDKPAGRNKGHVDLRDVDATRAGGYTDEHAASGTDAELPAIDVFPNQYRGYEIRIVHPEYTSICPKTAGHTLRRSRTKTT